ncbi:MFS transporter [Paraburkholderia acidicola]|uniref:MFS transporter n=1 Tax=Paraburkholderia acidicola TaxID=1912599 RepID=A0ABV1LHZ7_9BURK
MPSDLTLRKSSSGSRQAATRAIFFVAGYGRASWAPLVPFVKARVGLDDGQLGLLLLCLGAGSMVAMPFAGGLTSRFGCRTVIAITTVLLCATLPALAFVHDVPSAIFALTLFGMAAGVVDVAMNIQAIEVERDCGRSIMSGFHAFYSIGGIAGAAGASLLLTLGLSHGGSTAFAAVLMVVALFYAYPALIAEPQAGQASVFAIPHGIVLILSVFTFIVFLTESAVLDWSGVFLTSERGMSHAYAGYGYAAFATLMTVGRLMGDRVVNRLGKTRVVVAGSLCAATGFLVVSFADSWVVDLFGYALVGAGCSNIAPVLFSSVGKQKIMPTSTAVAAMTTIGYCGVFVGPALIGALARYTSLASALLGIVVLLAIVAASARAVLRNA